MDIYSKNDKGHGFNSTQIGKWGWCTVKPVEALQ